MPSFIKDLSLRRRSKASIKVSEIELPPELSAQNKAASAASPPTQRNKSSSTLSSFFDRSSGANTLSSHTSHTNLASSNGGTTPPDITGTTPPTNGARPRMPSHGKRYSLVNVPSQDGETVRNTPATSPWAPKILSISDGSWVHQKVLLIFGQCADPQQPIDGNVSIYHHQDNFPVQHWPVNDSYFKGLVYLQPGPNRLRLDFTSPKLQTPGGSSVHSSWININFLPLINSPPLQLCMLVAKDSPGTYDAVPERIAKEGNDLDLAISKFRMGAYLWQAFTAEHMNRNGFGRRCYRYEEEWQQGTMTWKDLESGTMRNEAKVHVIRLDKTVAEIQDLDLAQQFQGAKRNGELYSIAYDAVRDYFRPRSGHPQYVSCMFLDTRWDKDVGTIRGHAALGGGDDYIKLAIFGSHCLQSYPSTLEEVVPAFTDCTRTDTNHVANDCNEAGSNWEAVNIGIGAHLHEVGHLLGCPHQESGIMLRDYTSLHRAFLTREPYSTRTKQPGQRLLLPPDEPGWHRLDTLRFRYHPSFQLPSDNVSTHEASIQVWGVESNAISITALTGVAWIELFPDGDGECHHFMEFSDHQPSGSVAPRQLTLTEQMIKDRLPDDKRKKKLRIDIFSCGGQRQTVHDVYSLMGKDARFKLPDGRPGFRSNKLGSSGFEDSEPQEIMLSSAWKQKEPLLSVRVYSGSALDGLEFFYEGGKSVLFGKRGGKPGGDEFPLDIRRGETILGFHVRAGFFIDAIQILTSTGRRSELYGGGGGAPHTLVPPRGYTIAGLYGSAGQWVDGLGLIITR